MERVSDLTYSLFYLLFGLSTQLITGGELATIKRFDHSSSLKRFNHSNPLTFIHSCLLPTDAEPQFLKKLTSLSVFYLLSRIGNLLATK